MENIQVEFTLKDIKLMYDAIGRITGVDDFEYQDDDYRDSLIDLELKLYKTLIGAK